MDSYSSLLERSRAPQPSLQKFAVISIFEKLRSAPPRSGLDSDTGKDVITQCLRSASPAVVDQSVRELCRLVTDSKFDLSRGFLELQSALEGCDSRFVNVFVKGIGFLVRYGLQKNPSSFLFYSSETHPFVKVLSCRGDIQSELLQQVLLFMAYNKLLGMVEVCEYLRPFLNFAIISVPLSASFGMFVKDLMSAMASLCCSFPLEAIPIIKLLVQCLKYFPCKDASDCRNLYSLLGFITDAYVVVLRYLVRMGKLVNEAQLCGVELVETVFALSPGHYKYSGGIEPIVEVSKRLLCVQKELGFGYIPGLSSVIASLFMILVESELEHDQISILKLLLFLLKWKSENEFVAVLNLCEEILFIFPVINLVSSPSKSVKLAAINLVLVLEKLLENRLVAPKQDMSIYGTLRCISRPEDIVFRLFQRLLPQDQPSLCISFVLNNSFMDGTNVNDMQNVPRTWTSLLREYSKQILVRRKSSLPITQFQEIFLAEMPLILSAIGTVLVVHGELGSSAVDFLSVIGTMDPKLSVSLLLVVLFYNKVLSGKEKDNSFHNMPLKLLEMLPSLASHPVMIPLIVQTILPMLQKDAKPDLYATATRLLCKAWEINDRVFGTLQGVLHPKGFTQFISERIICISMAASIRDICRKNPDRGVDLILSVSTCIESQDPTVKALGVESLSHLCEADVIDFYTAWDVIAEYVMDSLSYPHVANSACLLLRWGAMDSEAYPEAARNVLSILWDIGISKHSGHGSLWTKARASAFDALTYYEVLIIQDSIPEFKKRNIDLITSEVDLEVLRAMEVLQVKIITFEHITRRRFVKEKKVPVTKIEKLLDIFPEVMFSSGNDTGARDLPGSALYCLSLTPKDASKGFQNLQGLQDINGRYESAMVEIAASLLLSRSILTALLSLQSWKPFMQRWINDCVTFLNAKTPLTVLDKTSKAANGILKITRRLAVESFPRSAENIALALGALCEVLPPSSHAVKSTASKFLLDWLFQYEHEHRQWSAAISLGHISSCLHVTDHKQKFENIRALIEVASRSRSTLVKGACGIGLGFSCHDILTSVEAFDTSNLEKGTYRLQEVFLLGKTVRALCRMILQFNPSISDLLENLSVYFPLDEDDADSVLTLESLDKNNDDLGEDIWGIAGLVIGLGSSIGALYRAGAHGAVLKIKGFIMSYVPYPSIQNCSSGEGLDIVFSVGSCLALPSIVAFCQRVELMQASELDCLVSGYKEIISELASVKKSGTFHQSLLMASCVGAGSLIACILNEGVHLLETGLVKEFLTLFRKTYSDPHTPLIHLGGMLGVVNALGVGAATFVYSSTMARLPSTEDQKQSFSIMGPLMSSSVLEPQLTSLIQEMFLVAQNSEDHQLQQYAAWAISFLRHHLFSKEVQSADGSTSSKTGGQKPVSQNFPDDTVVMKLSLWLMHLKCPGIGTVPNAYTVSAVLRCLSRAPRLPALDWGAIIRRCMKYEGQVAELSPNFTSKRGIVRAECLQFSLAHATQFSSLLSFIDELTDLSRFRMLELNIQSCIFSHLVDLIKIFSVSRVQKLFSDVAIFLSSLLCDEVCDVKEKSLLRISCWKGIYQCMDEPSVDAQEYVLNMEKCMEVLFCSFSPVLHSTNPSALEQVQSLEWSAGVRCLAKAKQGWLLDLLQISEGKLIGGGSDFSAVAKKIQAKARLVKIGSIPLSELGKLKAYLLNTRSEGVWDVLVEVVASLQHVEGSFKRQWLIDAVEISCVTNYPSTALQFLGLLCGSFSKYMPLLIIDPSTVLSDLPVTLSSLLSDSSWVVVAESVASYLWASAERIYDWATCIGRGECSPGPQPIDSSENDMAHFLLRVMHQACVCLKDYLPPEKQLKLANLVVP